MKNAMLLCFVTGFFLGVAPLLGRLSSVNAMMMAVLIAGGTLTAMLPVAFSQNYAAAGLRSLMFALSGGIANGVGLLFFYRLVAGSNEGLWEISRVLPISLVLMVMSIAIGARIFFGEAFTNEKVIGLILACGAIWFLK
ncbi:hypothetical protein HYU72_01040 [Candidatus Berkelbacteria bacterium]|nr:hypothetical protein [Candidatus Berkelbacteria bacterium]